MDTLGKDALVTLNSGETAYLSAVQCGACNEIIFVTYPKSPNFCAACGCSYTIGIDQLIISITALSKHAQDLARVSSQRGFGINQVMSLFFLSEVLKQALLKLNDATEHPTRHIS